MFKSKLKKNVFWLCTTDDIDQNMPSQAELKSKPIWKQLFQKERENEAQKPHTGRGGRKVEEEEEVWTVQLRRAHHLSSGRTYKPAVLQVPNVPQQRPCPPAPHCRGEPEGTGSCSHLRYHHTECCPTFLLHLKGHSSSATSIRVSPFCFLS